MKTADEMRTIATRVIEMAANEGKMSIKYIVDADVDTEIIADELTKIGYEIEYLGHTIEICW